MMSAGQYVIPFSFKLPENIPGTFGMGVKDAQGKEQNLQIRYTVEMFIDTDALIEDELREVFTIEHEFEIREWQFTDDEVEKDVQLQ